MHLWLASCCLVVFSTPSISRELTGVVYSDHSGPSAHGVGHLSLATKGGLAEIDYAKPIEGRFSTMTCWELGAIWTVWTGQTDAGEELIRAQCNGAVDEAVHSAWNAAHDYIDTTARAAGHETGFQPNRRGPIFVTLKEVKVELSGYLQFPGRGMCLEVKERVNRSTVIIATSADCYFYPGVNFVVERISPSAWSVKREEVMDRLP